MIKNYLVNGKEWQFEEGQQPSGAVELGAKAPEKPAEKAAEKPANKAKPAPKNKAR